LKDLIIDSINESIVTKEKLKEHREQIEEIANHVLTAIRKNGTIFLFGNGGSAADAQHIAAELGGRFRERRLTASSVALTTNTSVLTALGNDFGYDMIFAMQVEVLATNKDVVIGISTSGNSINVVKGIEAAKTKGAFTICLTGHSGGKLSSIADLTLKVPSNNTQRIQEAHILVGHLICEIVQTKL